MLEVRIHGRDGRDGQGVATAAEMLELTGVIEMVPETI